MHFAQIHAFDTGLSEISLQKIELKFTHINIYMDMKCPF